MGSGGPDAGAGPAGTPGSAGKALVLLDFQPQVILLSHKQLGVQEHQKSLLVPSLSAP